MNPKEKQILKEILERKDKQLARLEKDKLEGYEDKAFGSSSRHEPSGTRDR